MSVAQLPSQPRAGWVFFVATQIRGATIVGMPRAVSTGDLDSLLAQLRRSTPNPEVGLYGPGSVSWKVNRESALFLAAGRAALLQLAHPWVAAAIAQHSRTLQNPIARFHNTFRIMFTVSFGSLEQATAVARYLHRMHETIHGSLSQAVGRYRAGSAYFANEISALAWVFATLIDSTLLAYDLALPPLSESEREQYYHESLQSAALFGIARDAMPPNLAAFQLHMQSMMESDLLGVSAIARRLAQQLQSGTGLPMSPPFWYRALTIQLLPQRLRQEFQFDYGDPERQSAARALRWVRRVYPRLPAILRFVGPYNEVLGRLSGCTKPTPVVRLSNQLWIGQPALFGRP
jgi:uncharacterized protein (DUF2236 family)